MDVEQLSAIAVDCGLKVHKDLGPGMLESAYEAVLARLLMKRGLSVERQKVIPISYDGLIIEQGFRADLIVEDMQLIELKTVEKLSLVHARQVRTYLKFTGLHVGLLMNFSTEKFTDGLKRIVNNHVATQNSLLNINQTPSRSFAPSRPSREIKNPNA
ncbi:MAG: GxxExxY protein [Sphingorhabdus sp.]|uniref:GxxExxY protein n=1 Tax=Sphingorhabdus sp. TaxID=1902408 RepID=UPI003C8DA57A